MNYLRVALGEVCQINPRPKKDELPDDATSVSFVPMAAVDERQGSISRLETKSFGEVRKGFTPFRDDDVLFAKITPCMENGKSAIAKNLMNGIGYGSTEFYVLRPSEQVLSEYIYYFVRQEAFRVSAKRNFTGTAGQQRVPRQFLETAEIPLPPLDEQRRIVDILDHAASIRRLREEAQKKMREIIPALFVMMFGDPVTNSKGWEVAKLCDVGTLNRGKSKHRPRNDPILLGGPHPLIQTGDVANADGVLRSYTSTYSDVGLAQSKKWNAGTLCITIAANIAETAVLGFDACFPDSVVGFLPNERVSTKYVQTFFEFLQPYLERNAPQAAQKNINLKILRELVVPVPPIELQTVFDEHVNEVLSLAKLVTSSSALSKRNASSLTANIFASAT